MDDLGKTGLWQIRSVPEQVKQYFVDRAHAERCSVAELLTRIAMQDQVPAAPHDASHDTSVDDLCRLAEAAARVAETADRMPKGLRASLFRALRDGTRTRPPASKRPALPAPGATDAS